MYYMYAEGVTSGGAWGSPWGSPGESPHESPCSSTAINKNNLQTDQII